MKKFFKPDWTNSNLNISATLAEFLGAPNKNATLPILKNELAKSDYKNVVFICLDGLGMYPIKVNLKEGDFLRKNIKQTLLSTFPSTTTNATTSLMENKLPLEHGWFGWSVHFEKINRNINIFLGSDSWTDELVDIEDSPLGELDYYFDHAKSKYNINSVFPEYVKVKRKDRNNVYTTIDEFFGVLFDICARKGKQFVYAYYPDPDATMHSYGVSSVEAHSVIDELSKRIENLTVKTKDTLFIITADHGQIDVEDYVELYNDKKLMSMLKIYPFLEARAPAFKVKEDKKEEFEKYFTEKYGKDFELYRSQELIDQGYFGDFGDKANLLGDYIAIGTYTHKQALLTPLTKRFKGHHTSLTEEMEVPLIIVGT